MKKILLIILLLVILIVAGLAWLGFLPVLSPVFAKPRDLGIQTDQALVVAFDQKYEMKNELPNGLVPSDRDPQYEGSKELNLELTGAEVSSILEYWKKQYAKVPIRQVQVLIHDDGSAEISGILELATAVSMAKMLGYSDQDIEKGKSYARYVAGDLPFYISGTGGVKNNQVTINPKEIQVGRLNLPSNIAEPVAAATADIIQRRMGQIPGVNIQELTLENGQVKLLGSIPDTVK